MGHDEAADLLQETLDEEKAADENLTKIAEGGINQHAAEIAHPMEDMHEVAVPRRSTTQQAGTRKNRH
jgi:hypothetical protein